MTVLVETEEYTIETLEMIPKSSQHTCRDCGGFKKQRKSKRCPSCSAKHATKVRMSKN